jgi:large subunit ribosomal protein L25
MTEADLDKPVKLQERATIRKGLNALRREGMTPGVIHNHGNTSVHVVAPTMELTKVYNAAGKHHPLELKVGSDKYLALIKDAQFNPVKRRLDHVVFQAIKRNEKVQAEVPIHIEGDAPAEKVGLMILHQLDHVDVEALPKNLPDALVADATKLAELHDAITVADLQVPEGVAVLTDAEHPIARVVETPAQVSEEAEELTPEEGAAEAAAGDGGPGDKGNAPEGAEKEAAGEQAPGKPGK